MRKVAVGFVLLCVSSMFFMGSNAQEKDQKKLAFDITMLCPQTDEYIYHYMHEPNGSIASAAEVAVYAVGMDSPYPIIPSTVTFHGTTGLTWKATFDSELDVKMGHWVIADAWDEMEFDSDQALIEVENSDTAKKCELPIDLSKMKTVPTRTKRQTGRDIKVSLDGLDVVVPLGKRKKGNIISYVYKKTDGRAKIWGASRKRHHGGDLTVRVTVPKKVEPPYTVVVRYLGFKTHVIIPVTPERP